MVRTESGMCMSCKEEQEWNAHSPIAVTELGMLTLWSDLQR